MAVLGIEVYANGVCLRMRLRRHYYGAEEKYRAFITPVQRVHISLTPQKTNKYVPYMHGSVSSAIFEIIIELYTARKVYIL